MLRGFGASGHFDGVMQVEAFGDGLLMNFLAALMHQ